MPLEFRADRLFLHPVTKSGQPLTLLLDSGGGGALVSAMLASRLGLASRRLTIDGTIHQSVQLPAFASTAWAPKVGTALILDPVPEFLDGAHGMLGQSWHNGHVWMFEYPRRQGWVWQGASSPSILGPDSLPLAFQTDASGRRQNGFPRLTAQIDGRHHDFLLDTGATLQATGEAAAIGPRLRGTSFVVASVFDRWRERHPQWRVVEQADALGLAPMIEVPAVQLGNASWGPVWFTRRPDSNFHETMARLMDRPVDGALGGSLWRHGCLLIDYRASRAHAWQGQDPAVWGDNPDGR